jgi:hypothetical protein
MAPSPPAPAQFSNSVQPPSRVIESPQLKSKLFIKATAPSGASAKALWDEGLERRGEICSVGT